MRDKTFLPNVFMKWKRAIIGAVVLWVAIFFEVSILMFGLGLPQTSVIYYLIHFLAIAIFIVIVTVSYFHGKKIKVGFREGLYLGLIFVGIGVILDSLITIPLFMRGDYSFFTHNDIVIGLLETIVIAGVVGMVMKKR